MKYWATKTHQNFIIKQSIVRKNIKELLKKVKNQQQCLTNAVCTSLSIVINPPDVDDCVQTHPSLVFSTTDSIGRHQCSRGRFAKCCYGKIEPLKASCLFVLLKSLCQKKPPGWGQHETFCLLFSIVRTPSFSTKSTQQCFHFLSYIKNRLSFKKKCFTYFFSEGIPQTCTWSRKIK